VIFCRSAGQKAAQAVIAASTFLEQGVFEMNLGQQSKVSPKQLNMIQRKKHPIF
jgi:hypothetical protein